MRNLAVGRPSRIGVKVPGGAFAEPGTRSRSSLIVGLEVGHMKSLLLAGDGVCRPTRALRLTAEEPGLPTRSGQHLTRKTMGPVELPSRRACPSSVQPPTGQGGCRSTIRLDSRRASPRPAEADAGADAGREVQLPFYRPAEICRRQGIDLDCTMLANWSGRAAVVPQPIIDAMITDLIGCHGLVAPRVPDGGMNRDSIETCVAQDLAPVLGPGQIVAADNLAPRKSAQILALLRDQGNEPIFLPPYAPDLNLIEMAFSKLKTVRRENDPADRFLTLRTPKSRREALPGPVEPGRRGLRPASAEGMQSGLKAAGYGLDRGQHAQN